MECFVCGRPSGDGTGLHWDPFICCAQCYQESTESYATIIAPFEALRDVFPLVEGLNVYAEHFGGCRREH